MPTAPTDYRTPAICAGVLAALSIFFWWTFDERYLKYEDCISQLVNSSCLTPDGGNVTQGGILWGLIALFLDGLALCFVLLIAFRFVRDPWRKRAGH